MIRNDYRRALIMLRGLDKGLTGHVRLERRTLIGTMQFSVNGTSGDSKLYAALLTRHTGRWTGATLGALGRDGRGQAGLNSSFDPRNIAGLDLEEYSLIAIIAVGKNTAHLAMCGYVNGTVDVDWAQVHAAAGALFIQPPVVSQPAESAFEPVMPAEEMAVTGLPEAVIEKNESDTKVSPIRQDVDFDISQSNSTPWPMTQELSGGHVSPAPAMEEEAPEDIIPIPEPMVATPVTEEKLAQNIWDSALEQLQPTTGEECPEDTFTTIIIEEEEAYNIPQSSSTLPDAAGEEASCENIPPEKYAPNSEVSAQVPPKPQVIEAFYIEPAIEAFSVEPPVAMDIPSDSIASIADQSPPQAEEKPIMITAVTMEGGRLSDRSGNIVEVDMNQMPAGLLLDLDITVPWPPSVEALRSVFLKEILFTPFHAPDYVFVRAPLPSDTRMGYCAVGIKCVDKRPATVCYGIPGIFALEPPPGLEGYAWRGDGSEGFWVVFLDTETGEEVDE